VTPPEIVVTRINRFSTARLLAIGVANRKQGRACLEAAESVRSADSRNVCGWNNSADGVGLRVFRAEMLRLSRGVRPHDAPLPVATGGVS